MIGGVDALDQYLKIQASQDIKKNAAVTYALKAMAFYKHFGFISLPDNSHRLFLLMSTVKKLDL